MTGDGPGPNPVQRRTLDLLSATPDDRPEFPEDTGARLRAELDAGLADVIAELAPDEDLQLTKHLLQRIHGCEVRMLAEDRAAEPFRVTIPIARGTVVHKAIELGVHHRGDPSPLDLVDAALGSLETTDHWLTEFLNTCSETERAELRGAAGDGVAKFFECFPPLQPSWRPVTESTQIADLANDRVRLRGKVDLTLGIARGNRAGKVVIDLKTGAPNPIHRDDLRFYALLDTLRIGIPPRLIASFYLDLGEAHTEPVTEALLAATVARTIDAAERLVALRNGTAAPRYRPSHACRWCPILTECEIGRTWLAEADVHEP